MRTTVDQIAAGAATIMRGPAGAAWIMLGIYVGHLWFYRVVLDVGPCAW